MVFKNPKKDFLKVVINISFTILMYTITTLYNNNGININEIIFAIINIDIVRNIVIYIIDNI